MEYFLLYSLLQPMLDICQVVGLAVIKILCLLLFTIAYMVGDKQSHASPNHDDGMDDLILSTWGGRGYWGYWGNWNDSH